MEEIHAMLGILLIAAIAMTSYFVFASGGIGAAVSQTYSTCCCDILTGTTGEQFLVRSQIQTFENTCQDACKRYEGSGHVFAQEGLCAV